MYVVCFLGNNNHSVVRCSALSFSDGRQSVGFRSILGVVEGLLKVIIWFWVLRRRFKANNLIGIRVLR